MVIGDLCQRNLVIWSCWGNIHVYTYSPYYVPHAELITFHTVNINLNQLWGNIQYTCTISILQAY